MVFDVKQDEYLSISQVPGMVLRVHGQSQPAFMDAGRTLTMVGYKSSFALRLVKYEQNKEQSGCADDTLLPQIPYYFNGSYSVEVRLIDLVDAQAVDYSSHISLGLCAELLPVRVTAGVRLWRL